MAVVRRDLPGLQCARLRHRPLDHRPGGRRGVRHRQRPGRRLLRRVRRRRHRPDAADVRRRRHWRWCPTPATTRAATTSDWNCTAPPTASPPAGATAPRCATSNPAPPGRPAPPDQFFMDRLRRRLPRRTQRLHRSRCRAADLAVHRRGCAGVAWIAEAATLSLQQHRPVQIDEVTMTTVQIADRRSTDLLGRVRGPRLGLPAHVPSGCSPRCTTSACPQPNSDRTGSCPPTPTEWPRPLTTHHLTGRWWLHPRRWCTSPATTRCPRSTAPRRLRRHPRRGSGAVRGLRTRRLRQPPGTGRRRLEAVAAQPRSHLHQSRRTRGPRGAAPARRAP